MHILQGNVTFYDVVSIIHDVVTIRNPFPYTAKFMFVGVRNNKTQQIRRCKINRIRIYSAVVYQKYLTRLREMIIFSPRLENYQFSQPSQIFLIYDSTIYVFSIYALNPILLPTP